MGNYYFAGQREHVTAALPWRAIPYEDTVHWKWMVIRGLSLRRKKRSVVSKAIVSLFWGGRVQVTCEVSLLLWSSRKGTLTGLI